MPYDVSWHDEAHSIVRLDIHGKVSWDEWHVAVNQLTEKLAEVSHRVDFIFYDTVGMPPGNPLPHIKSTMAKLGRFPNAGLVVTVSSARISAVVKSLLSIAARASGLDASQLGRFVSTMDEAIALIAKDRASKPVE